MVIKVDLIVCTQSNLGNHEFFIMPVWKIKKKEQLDFSNGSKSRLKMVTEFLLFVLLKGKV